MRIQIYVFSTATVHNLHLYFIGFANETVKAQRGWLTNSRSQSREAETLGIGLKTALQQLLSSHGSSSPSSTVHPLEMISWTAFVFILNWDRRKVLSVPVASPFLSVTAVGYESFQWLTESSNKEGQRVLHLRLWASKEVLYDKSRALKKA